VQGCRPVRAVLPRRRAPVPLYNARSAVLEGVACGIPCDPRRVSSSLTRRGPPAARYTRRCLHLALIAVAYQSSVCIADAARRIRPISRSATGGWGSCSAAVHLCYALFEWRSGWLADRFRRPASRSRGSSYGGSVMTAATGLAGASLSLVLIRFLFGAGGGRCLSGDGAGLCALADAARRRGRMFGLAIMTGALAGAATQPAGGYPVDAHELATRVSDLRQRRRPVGACLVALVSRRPHPARRGQPGGAPLDGCRRCRDTPPRDAAWGKLARNRTMLALCCMYGGAIYGCTSTSPGSRRTSCGRAASTCGKWAGSRRCRCSPSHRRADRRAG